MANVWKDFEALLPKRAYQIGKVVSVDASKRTAIITLLSGDDVQVSGEGAIVDDHVIIENGIILHVVPELTLHNVTIY